MYRNLLTHGSVSAIAAGLLMTAACNKTDAPPTAPQTPVTEAPPAVEAKTPSAEAVPSEVAKPSEEAREASKPPASSRENLAKIGEAYGTYVSESRKDGDEANIYRFTLEAGTFVCNGSNYKVERRSFPYYVVSAGPRRFQIAFEDMSANRTLTFGYDGSDKLSIEEGRAPSDCGWSLDSGAWVRTEQISGAAPAEVRALPRLPSASSEKLQARLGDDTKGPKGSVRARAFAWVKKIGFSKAEPDEKFGQLSVEVRNESDEPIDFELAHASDDEMVSFSCETGSESGGVGSCERPHFGDETPKGLIPPGKKISFNYCRKFEKEAAGCKARIDMRSVGGGMVEVDLGK